MDSILAISREFLQNTNLAIIYIVIYLLGLYIYWRACIQTHKNRSGIFDSFITAGFFGLFVSRLLYIIIEWDRFASFIWYWIPYEKYGDKIYLFRLLPWKFFNILDGGLVIFGLFIGLILFLTFFVLVIKNWRWKHMYFPIYLSSVTMLSLSLLFTGFVSEISTWLIKGGVLLATVLAFIFGFVFFNGINRKVRKDRYILSYAGLLLTWLSSAYIGYIYLFSDITLIEQILVGLFLLWSIVMGVFFVIDLKKANVSIESISSVRSVRER